MKVTLYTTGCPRCRVLESKLNAAGVEYTSITDTDEIEQMGFTNAPVLKVDDDVLDFKSAVDWVNQVN